jgi:hypothetical protein
MTDFFEYDPKEIIVIAGGAPISGFSDEFVTLTFEKESFTKTRGIDATQRAKTNDYGGSITLTLMGGSPSNDVLSAFWNADRATSEGKFPIIIKDNKGTTIWTASNAWVKKMPDQKFTKDAPTVAWEIDCADIIGHSGGNI